MIKIDWYQLSIDEDGEQIDLTIKSPSFTSYSNLIINNTYENRLLFLQENIIKPDYETINTFFNKYPAMVDDIVEQIGDTFKKHIEELNDNVKKKWKSFENNYTLGGRALLCFLDKPLTEDNMALSYLLLDGLSCLRHLRAAYTKAK